MRGFMLRALLLIFLLTCSSSAALAETHIGICIYSGEDTFIASMLGAYQAQAEGAAVLHIADAQGDQNKQNDLVEEFLHESMDVLLVNPVDRTGAVYLIKLAMQFDTPIIFFNREPLTEDLRLYDKAYYVGIDPKQQGILCGKLVADYFRTHANADKNGDGIIQLVVLKGEPGHQDAELRTTNSLKALAAEGFLFEKLQEDAAMWRRDLGQERMAANLNTFSDQIECVISNNDDMALGAIDALKAAGYFANDRFMPVVGIDGTEPAREALTLGTLYGTVFNDWPSQSRAGLELALLLAQGETITAENYPYALEDKCVYLPSVIITNQ